MDNMSLKKTAYHFGTCCPFTFSDIVGFHVFVVVWEHCAVFGTNADLKQTPLQNKKKHYFV